ncbi:MAG TPA: hypothetical protein VK034_19225, partial [Enhygromyxa sp.]|nr:hypothetical protein [Enhygromyxa sp.]
MSWLLALMLASAPPEESDRPRARLLEAPRIPPIGPVQPWVTLNSWTEYFNENYDGIDRNEGFVSLVNRLNLGLDARLPRSVGLSLASRV